MYLDYILFAVGGVLLLLAVVLAAILLVSGKRSREYRRILQEDTQRTDILETLRQTCANQTAEAQTEAERTETESTAPDGETELLPDGERRETELLFGEEGTARINIAGRPAPRGQIGSGLDLSPLAGKYELLSEIHGGGMSRVFLAKHLKLGSEWIVKYVDGSHAELANEAEVLKKLNHLSLPQIIDVFEGQQGTFLVERYIEGYPLSQVLRLEGAIREGQILDWGLQLAQVLQYLHTLPTPIIHCDLKPSNLMVTHDNRLVLIDFGISKREGVDEKALGLTYRYAAPEQFRGAAAEEAAPRRFGELPAGHEDWKIDVRTDLYSAGVILYELITREALSGDGSRQLRERTTDAFADVVARCIRLDPEERYQSAGELVAALEQVKAHQLSMARSLVRRQMMKACAALLVVSGLGVSASGAYINREETRAVVAMDPIEVAVTAQQGIRLHIQKETESGRVVTLEPDRLEWTYSKENIARLEGENLVGMNPGEVTVRGSYRGKEVTMHVTVTEPVKQLVKVALRYDPLAEISVFAGTGERECINDTLERCAMISPERITADGDSFYFGDSGQLRVLEDGEVYSVNFEDEYLTTQIVWSYGPAFYILTNAWEEEDASYYGILKITDESAGFIYCTEANGSVTPDIAFDSEGTLWFIQRNMQADETSLARLNPVTYDPEWVMYLPDSARSMVFDESDNLYISVPEEGTVLRVPAGADHWDYFAGVAGERNFIDGAIANFYQPTSLALDGNSLYVLDFDTVRRVTIEGSTAVMTETVAGLPIPDSNPDVKLGAGYESILSASELASIAVNESGQLVLTDPKNSVIYEITAES